MVAQNGGTGGLFLNEDEIFGEPEGPFIPISPGAQDKKMNKELKDFSTLLETLDNSLNQKKILWKQIHENATLDRKYAHIAFTDLFIRVYNHPAEHAIHGQTLSKYIERMNKSTDQLLKLAELVADAEEKVSREVEETDGMDDANLDIYDQIKKQSSSLARAK